MANRTVPDLVHNISEFIGKIEARDARARAKLKELDQQIQELGKRIQKATSKKK
jgi:hypothetical protein